MNIIINNKSYNARQDPQSNKIEAEFQADLNHDGIADEGILVWADVKNGFSHYTSVNGIKTLLHIDDVNGELIAHSGQMVKMADGSWVEIYKNTDGSWGTSSPDIKPEDFVFDEENTHPPYGLAKDQIPQDADLDLFGVEYEYEKQV